MSRRVILSWAVLALLQTSTAWAQIPFAKDLVPTRTALGRLGLEQHWMVAVPLGSGERLKVISLAEGFIFAQTSLGNFHAIDAETGRVLWSANLGTQSAEPQPASVNSTSVFVTNLNRLFRLDRKTGRIIWMKELDTLPSTPTSCTDDCVMIGLQNGKVYGFGLKAVDTDRKLIDDRAVEIWNWQTDRPMRTRPLITPTMAFAGSDDGKVYAALAKERVLLFRILTGGAIGEGFGTVGTRMLIAPSADRKIYGIDIFEPKIVWVFPSSAPVLQAPLVADGDIYIVNKLGELSSLDSKNGTAKWTTSTLGGRLIAIGDKRIYLESHDEDLFIVDRATGKVLVDPRESRQRVGLNLRSYDLGITNSINDRIYLGTTSGLVLSLREIGETTPRPLRDPSAKPFSYVPVEGESTKADRSDQPPVPGTPEAPATPEEPPAEEPK